MALDIGGYTISSEAECVFIPLIPLEVEYLVIAGGGGGGSSSSGLEGGGGGGAGGYRSSVNGESSGGGASSEVSLSLSTGATYSITIGAGGGAMTNGTNSCFDSIVSIGGGRGGCPVSTTSSHVGASGGSGGGGSGYSANRAGGSGTTSQGYAGGVGIWQCGGGGGGGAAEVGNSDGCYQGGDGVASSITGTSIFRSGGGGGGQGAAHALCGIGGDGGGGAGGTTVTNASNGTTNTGGGGGGAGCGGRVGGNGGSGIVILRYPSSYTMVGSGVTVCTSTVGSCKVSCIISGTGTVTFS